MVDAYLYRNLMYTVVIDSACERSFSCTMKLSAEILLIYSIAFPWNTTIMSSWVSMELGKWFLSSDEV